MKSKFKIKRIVIIYLLINCFFLLSAHAVPPNSTQSVEYGIKVGGMKIGELTVKQQSVNNQLIVDAITDVEVKIIFTYKVKFLQHSVYSHGNLVSSHLQTIKNGNVNSDTWLKKHDNAYLLIQKGDTLLIHDAITYSGSLLYMNEPVHVPFLYMEIDGEKRPVKPEGSHTYVLTNKNGRITNRYDYKNGVLNHAEIKHTLATIYMDRSKNL